MDSPLLAGNISPEKSGRPWYSGCDIVLYGPESKLGILCGSV